MTAGFLCRCNNFFVSGGRISKPYIVFNRIVKQKNILEYDAEIRVKLFGVNFPNINSADGNTAGTYIPKSGHKSGQCCFSTSRWTYNSSHFFFRNIERNIMDHIALILLVLEGNIFKANVVLKRRLIFSFHNRHLFHLLDPFQRHLHHTHHCADIPQIFQRLIEYKSGNKKYRCLCNSHLPTKSKKGCKNRNNAAS